MKFITTRKNHGNTGLNKTMKAGAKAKAKAENITEEELELALQMEPIP